MGMNISKSSAACVRGCWLWSCRWKVPAK